MVACSVPAYKAYAFYIRRSPEDDLEEGIRYWYLVLSYSFMGLVEEYWTADNIYLAVCLGPYTALLLYLVPVSSVELRMLGADVRHQKALFHCFVTPSVVGCRTHMSSVIATAGIIIGVGTGRRYRQILSKLLAVTAGLKSGKFSGFIPAAREPKTNNKAALLTTPSSDVNTAAFSPGYPVKKGQKGQMLYRAGYTSFYNVMALQPYWVAWTLTREHCTGGSKRDSEEFAEDTDVPSPRADTYDYIGKESDITLLDMDQALSDVKKDQILDQYRYFVGDASNIGMINNSTADGIVIMK